MKTKQRAALILALLGIAMIVIGAKANILPPVLTGVGFGVIAFVRRNK